MNWWTAKEHCQTLNRRLMEVRTKDVYNETSDLKGLMDGDFWLGGSDIENEGHWVWNSDGEPVQFQVNVGNDPLAQNCLGMKKKSGNFHDRPCDNEIRFICEWV